MANGVNAANRGIHHICNNFHEGSKTFPASSTTEQDDDIHTPPAPLDMMMESVGMPIEFTESRLLD